MGTRLICRYNTNTNKKIIFKPRLKEYRYAIAINDEEILEKTNTRAQPFQFVSEWWSDPWAGAALASVDSVEVSSSRGALIVLFVKSELFINISYI